MFMLRNPQLVLGGWAAAWAWLLYTAYTSQGVVGAVQLATTGLLNVGSVIGLPIPLVLAAVMLARQLSQMGIRLLLSIFKRVQAESLKAAKKAGAAIAKAAKSVKKLRATAASSDDMLGSSPHHLSFLEALDELSSALADPDLALYF